MADTPETPPDPGSLENLHDVVMPEAVPWWPPATGWIVLTAIILIFATWVAIRWLLRYRADRYRRAALAELAELRQAMHDGQRDASRNLPVLLKRTALVAYPRSQVASLSGADWRQFLNDTAGRECFTPVRADTLDALAYGTVPAKSIAETQVVELMDAIADWLEQHRRMEQNKD